MARSSLFQSVDQNLDGQLETILAKLRADGCSLDDMLHDFRNRGVMVSRQTIANWLRQLEPQDAA